MGDNPLNQAIQQLDNTMKTISQKVELGKQRANAYKSQIIKKLEELNNQINAIKNNNNLSSIPALRQQLLQSQNALADKTTELQTTKQQLQEATNSLQQLQNNVEQLNKDIQQKTEQINQLTESGQQKDQQIAQITEQINQLTQQKAQAEQNLAVAQQQIQDLINNIGQINTTLTSQIELIDSITTELGDIDSGEIAQKFQSIGENINTIMNMIGDQGQQAINANPNENIDVIYNNLMNANPTILLDKFFTPLRDTDKGDLIRTIQDNYQKAKSNDPNAIQAIKDALQQLKDEGIAMKFSGGRRSTRRKKARRMRGGYTYNSSKKLDRESSIISGSSTKKRRKHRRRTSTSSKSRSTSNSTSNVSSMPLSSKYNSF